MDLDFGLLVWHVSMLLISCMPVASWSLLPCTGKLCWGKREDLVVDWGEDDVATQLWVSASTKGGSQHLEFGALDWIGAKADVAMQLLVPTSTQGGT